MHLKSKQYLHKFPLFFQNMSKQKRTGVKYNKAYTEKKGHTLFTYWTLFGPISDKVVNTTYMLNRFLHFVQQVCTSHHIQNRTEVLPHIDHTVSCNVPPLSSVWIISHSHTLYKHVFKHIIMTCVSVITN